MADAHANPSRDPADAGSLMGMARQILDKFLQGVDGSLPARVVRFNGNRENPRVDVVPLVKLLTTDNRQITRAPIANLPVKQIGGGDALLSFDVRPGDLGWIRANDRDISIVMQAYRDNAPGSLRKHSFSDAVFEPDPMTGFTIVGEDAPNAVLQSRDGTVRVAIWADRLKLTAGALSITLGPSQIDVVGPVVFHDAVVMASTLVVGGMSSLAGGAVIEGMNFITHRHVGVQPGGGTSGGPTP